MSVSLNCPNCGCAIGEANYNDNYKENYYKNNNGNPICKNCSDSTFKINKKDIFIFVIMIGILVTLICLIQYIL